MSTKHSLNAGESTSRGATLKDLWYAVANLTSPLARKAQQRIVDITPLNAGYYGVLSSYRTNVDLPAGAVSDATLRAIARAKLSD